VLGLIGMQGRLNFTGADGDFHVEACGSQHATGVFQLRLVVVGVGRDHHQMDRHALEQRAAGEHFHALAAGGAAVEGKHHALRCAEIVGGNQNRPLHGADDVLQLAADVLDGIAAVLALATDDQQARLVLQITQGLDQITVALPALGLGDTGGDRSLACRIEHHPALFQRQLGALFVQCGQFLQEELTAAQADDAAQIARHRILLAVEHVQQRQRRIQALAGPGRIVANRRGLR